MGNSSAKHKMVITEIDRAVLSLKTQRNRLEDHRTRVMNQIEREKSVALQLVAEGHRDKALLALKKKRLQETTLAKLDAWLLNVESVLHGIESSKDQVRVVAVLKQGIEAQKQLQQNVALEDVEKLMADTAEAREYQDQLQRALGESWTNEDEDATEAALSALEKEVAGEIEAELKAELPEVPTTQVPAVVMKEKRTEKEEREEELPDVPTHAVPSVSTTGARKSDPLLAS